MERDHAHLSARIQIVERIVQRARKPRKLSVYRDAQRLKRTCRGVYRSVPVLRRHCIVNDIGERFRRTDFPARPRLHDSPRYTAAQFFFAPAVYQIGKRPFFRTVYDIGGAFSSRRRKAHIERFIVTKRKSSARQFVVVHRYAQIEQYDIGLRKIRRVRRVKIVEPAVVKHRPFGKAFEPLFCARQNARIGVDADYLNIRES